ncbi:MAG: alpha/beta hydrolase [Pseudonocardiales bacterium]|nr:MAG: alpha/beta hydrolase [Pseudonocardiales bacterium]
MAWARADDGIRLHYETAGVGEPLLLVAGQALSHTGWAPVLDAFAAHHQVIVFDHRGTGASDAPTGQPYSTRGFARDAVAVLDAVGVDRAHAYGHSMGGRVCQWLGIEHAPRLGALILGATTPGDRHGISRTAAADAVLRSRDRDGLVDLLVTPRWATEHPEALDSILTLPADPAQLRLHYLASQGHDTWDLLPRITAPTLLLHGSADQLNPPGNAELLAQRIAHAEVHLLNGARHGYYVDHPDATGVVVDFLARHPLSQQPAGRLRQA